MYYPTPNVTSAAGLAHLQSVYYKRKGLDRLQTVFRFGDACVDDMIPAQNGRSIQWFHHTDIRADQCRHQAVLESRSHSADDRERLRPRVPHD